MSAAATIQLVQYVGDPINTPFVNQFSWPLTIVATGTNIDSNIFVYQLAGSSFESIPGDTFSCVASTSQLNELPTSAAAAKAAATPFYRQSTMTVICRSAAEANYVWEQVQEDVDDLINNYNAAALLVPANVITLDGSGTTTPSTNSFFTLTAYPAGIITIQGQTTTIVSPQVTSAGWLPASSYSGSVPAGGIFYYNMALQTALGSLFPLSSPDSALLLRNNVVMPQNLVYQITSTTIWWNSFNPVSVPNYPDSSPYPWSSDYQNPTNTGTPLNLTFII
jgi:hypothetical protein